MIVSRFLPPSVVCLLFLLAGCRPASTPTARGGGPIPVELGDVNVASIPIAYSAVGTVQPIRTVAIKSQVDGVVESFHVKEGEQVDAGALLVTLDQRPLLNTVRMAKAEVANARAEEERARTEAERYRQLAKVAAISEEQERQLATKAATALAVLQVKEAALANAELQLGYTKIHAPFSGRIGQHGLHEGALVKANDANATLITLHQLKPISISFAVPDTLQLPVQQAVREGEVRVSAALRQDASIRFAGRLTFVDNAINATTGTLTLKAEFENEALQLWPGSYVEVTLNLGEIKEAVLVPDAAVQVGQAGPQIFVAKDDAVELRPVTLGRRWEGRTQIVTGLQPGEKVVVDGQLRLTPGAKIVTKKPVVAPAKP